MHPLTPATVQTLTAWLRERGGDPGEPAFPTRAGNALSRDAVARLLAKYVTLASDNCPALTGKTISPHTLTGLPKMKSIRSREFGR